MSRRAGCPPEQSTDVRCTAADWGPLRGSAASERRAMDGEEGAMNMNEVVTYEVDNGVAWLTINRPEARNGLSKAVRDGLWEGTRQFNDDDSAQVLVLT